MHPRPAAVRHDDRQRRKVRSNVVDRHRVGEVEVRTGAAAGHHDDRNAQVLAAAVDRVQAPVVGAHRRRIGSGLEVDRAESVSHGLFDFSGSLAPVGRIDRGRRDEAIRMQGDDPHDLVVADRTQTIRIPRRQQAAGDARPIHFGKQQRKRTGGRRRRRLEAVHARDAVAPARIRVQDHVEEAPDRRPHAKVDDARSTFALRAPVFAVGAVLRAHVRLISDAGQISASDDRSLCASPRAARSCSSSSAAACTKRGHAAPSAMRDAVRHMPERVAHDDTRGRVRPFHDPRAERLERLAAGAGEQRFLQPGQRDSLGGAQHQRFVDQRDGPVAQRLHDDLGRVAGSGLAHEEDGVAHRVQQRPHRVDGGRLSAHEERELRLLRALYTSRHRRVDVGNAQLLRKFRDGARTDRIAGRAIDEARAGFERAQDPVRPRHDAVHLVGIRQHQDGDVASCDGFPR